MRGDTQGNRIYLREVGVGSRRGEESTLRSVFRGAEVDQKGRNGGARPLRSMGIIAERRCAMDVEARHGLLRVFDEMEDPRVERAKRHPLTDILVFTLLAVICGADEWTEIELFGQSKLDWLRAFLQLPHGIPSHDTFGRVFSRPDPEPLEHCFQKWVNALAQRSGGRLIALDGKTLRRSFDQAGNKAAIPRDLSRA